MPDEAHVSTIYPDLCNDDAGGDRLRLLDVLHRAYAEPEPRAAFATLLGRQVEAEAARRQEHAGRPSRRTAAGLRRRRSLAGLGFAAALAIAATGAIVLMAGRSQQVSAQAILARAQAATGSAATSAPASFHLSLIETGYNGTAQRRIATEVWAAGVDHERIEETALDAAGRPGDTAGTVVDGGSEWRFTTQNGHTDVTQLTHDAAKGIDFGPLGENLAAVMAELGQSACGSVSQQGEASVAGRPVYVITVKMPANCLKGAPGKAGATAGTNTPAPHTTFWVDKQTYLPLKIESADGTAGKGYEVTSVEYNVAIPAATFTYAPPPGATVHDCRDATAPGCGKPAKQPVTAGTPAAKP